MPNEKPEQLDLAELRKWCLDVLEPILAINNNWTAYDKSSPTTSTLS